MRATILLLSTIFTSCTFLIRSEIDEQGEFCGDGVLHPNFNEECDGEQFASDCADLGFNSGSVICRSDCTIDATGCSNQASCGDNIIDAGEDCDGDDLSGESCTTQGFSGGTLLCSGVCEFDTSGCVPFCGNGQIDPGEQCDGVNLNTQSCLSLTGKNGSLQCNNDCTFDSSDCDCGDGVIDADETCDDNNAVNGDGCADFCSIEANFSCDGEPSVCALIPDAIDDNLSTDEDRDLSINVSELLANDLRVNGATVVSVQGEINCTATLSNGVVLMQPDLNFSGVATFTYTVENAAGEQDTANVRSTVVAVADAPTIVASTFTGAAGTPIALDLPVNLSDNDGSESLSVVLDNVPSGFSFSAGTIEQNEPTFLAPNTITTGSNPRSVARGDFNNDTFTDIVITNQNNNSVGVFLGNGLGGFGNPTNFTVGTTPVDVVVGRFNGDNFDDIAVANLNSDSVIILLNNTTGGFTVGSNITVIDSPQALFIGNFNGGPLDLVVVGSTTAAQNVSILLGNAGGGFSAPTNLAIGGSPHSDVIVGRLNNDNFDDVVVTNSNTGDLSIMLGNGDGTFDPPSSFFLGSTPLAMARGRFNNDAFDDIVVTVNGTIAQRFLCDGAGSFGGGIGFSIGSNSQGITVGRLDDDNFDDFAAASFGSNNVSVFFGDGAGNFSSGPVIPTGLGTNQLVDAKLNADNLNDLVVVNTGASNATVLLSSLTINVSLTQAQLAGLLVTAPTGFVGVITLSLIAIATEGSNGDSESAIGTTTLSIQ